MNKKNLAKSAMLGAVLALIAGALPGIARADTVVHVQLQNRDDGTMTMQFDHKKFEAGKVTFIVTNRSKDMDHEFLVAKTDLHVSQLPVTEDGTRVNEDALAEIHELEGLPPGKEGELVLYMKPGHYVAMCNLPGHVAAGMAAEFTVEPAAEATHS